jgi:tetratricopeptide (TPR) repeat protein
MKFPITRFLAGLSAVLLTAATVHAQTGGVRGKVLDDKGQPLEGVAIKLEFQGGMNLTFDAKTNKKGEYMQIGLRPGSWKFTYNKEGFAVFTSPARVSLGDATVLPDVKMVNAKAAAAAATGGEDVQKQFGDAVAKLQAGDHDGAIAAFDALIAKSPNLAEAHYNKGFAQFQKKDYAAAETTLKKALEVRTDYSDARVLLSNVYTAQGLKDKALEVMTSGGSTTDARQLFNLALALLNSGKNEEATAAFLKAEAADATNPEVQYYLATAALNAGKTDECITRLEKYLAMGPKSEQNKATATGLLGALKKK